METLILHDLRFWHVPASTTESLSAWRDTPLAKNLFRLRTQLAASVSREWCFAWEFEHPDSWRLIRRRESLAASRSKPGRGKMRTLQEADLWPFQARVMLNAWNPWLGLPDQLAVPLAQPPRPATIEPQIDSGQHPPPSGSILGHPARPGFLNPAAMRDAILLRYFRIAKEPHPEKWRKLLPPVLPKEKVFDVFDWQKMVDLLRSPM